MAKGLIISAPRSGAGKTTVMLGLLRCMRDDAMNVRPYKCGPDYIDPAFHHAACGNRAYNLDSWAMTDQLLAHLSYDAQTGIAVAEGSMGLFDGVQALGETGCGSSAEIAARTGWPVVLVIDVSGQAQTAAAVALGLKHYDAHIKIAGVILNRVASPRHEALCRAGFERIGIEVLGALPRRGDLSLPERHLGLIQAQEHPDLEAAIAAYAAFLRQYVDLPKLYAMAEGLDQTATPFIAAPPAQRIALARDAAFSFIYPHLMRLWQAAGAEIMPFSPLADETVPEADICWLPGGYPELHAGRLAANHRFMSSLRAFAARRPVHGECGGYMVLGQGLIDATGKRHQMAGLLGLETSYASRKMHLGYRLATLEADMPGLPRGTRLRGHEFHYSTVVGQPDLPLARVTDANGALVAETGSRRGHVSGTFFHMIARAS